MPGVSIVMKDLERFDVISLVSASERRGMSRRHLLLGWLLLEALPREESSLLRSLDRLAAYRRLSRSACSLALQHIEGEAGVDGHIVVHLGPLLLRDKEGVAGVAAAGFVIFPPVVVVTPRIATRGNFFSGHRIEDDRDLVAC
jgi:hypothetical protein